MPYGLLVRRRYVHYYDGLGVLTFTASASHSVVTDYTIRLYALNTTSPVLRERNIGKPTPDESNQIRHDINSMLTGLSNGNYYPGILVTSTGGSVESAGTAFSLPLTG